MVNLGIIGSSVIDRRQAEHAWALIEGLILAWEPEEVWSGGATGIDSVADTVAGSLCYHKEFPQRPCIQGGLCPGCTSACWARGKFVECLPEVKSWDPVGKKGYKARNIEIVNGVDRLVRIAKKDNQATYGSGWTADYAEEQLGAENVFRYYV